MWRAANAGCMCAVCLSSCRGQLSWMLLLGSPGERPSGLPTTLHPSPEGLWLLRVEPLAQTGCLVHQLRPSMVDQLEKGVRVDRELATAPGQLVP